MSNKQQLSSLQLSRRHLIRLSVGAGFVLGAGASLAQTSEPTRTAAGGCSTLIPKKSSQQDARHRAEGYQPQICENCRFFVQPNQCLIVEGMTSAKSSCALWAKIDQKPIDCAAALRAL